MRPRSYSTHPPERVKAPCPHTPSVSKLMFCSSWGRIERLRPASPGQPSDPCLALPKQPRAPCLTCTSLRNSAFGTASDAHVDPFTAFDLPAFSPDVLLLTWRCENSIQPP
ncbi:hypothetical protein M3J09_002145 [Ascochyta lentis]